MFVGKEIDDNMIDFFRNKVFVNKRRTLIFCLIFSLFLLCVFFMYDDGSIVFLKETNAIEIMREYEILNNTDTENGKEYPEVDIAGNKFIYTDINEILSVFNNNGDAVIFFSYASCLYCRTAIQVLHDTAKDTEIEKIYYLDVEDKVNGYDKLLNVLDSRFKTEENGEEIIYSPLVLFIVDGKVVSHHKGTLFSQDTPYNELDQSQIDGLSEIYRYGIRDVLNGMKNN